MKLALSIDQKPQTNIFSHRSNFLVHDGVYADPLEVRKEALRRGFRTQDVGFYAGRNSFDRTVDPSIVALFSKMVGSEIVIADRDAFGVFRNSTFGESAKTYIHTDPVTWGGVLYLNPPDNCMGGTGFWRHRETGLEEFPWTSWNDYGFKSVDEAWRKFVLEDGNNPERWDLTFVCPARFNRVVLFNSRLFHSHLPRENFGHDNETGRLVQVFFFEPKAD